MNETTCELCHEVGHAEDSCNLVWRTFIPRPSDLKKVPHLLVSCFGCGSSQHYGMDCRYRSRSNPKRAAAATFSLKNAELFVNDSSSFAAALGLNPNANAGANASSGEIVGDYADFIRPKVMRNGGEGSQIRFGNNSFNNSPAFHAQSSATSQGAPYRPSYGPISYNQADAYRPDYGASNRPLSTQHESPYPVYGHGSAAVQRRDSWHPPPPGPPLVSWHHGSLRTQGVGRGVSNQSYRPMPSAAKNAWKKHRVG